MSRFRAEAATMEHAAELALTMRAADVEELDDVGRQPYEALAISLAGSRDAYAALVDGKVACIFGVYPRSHISDEAFPWLLASDLIIRHGNTLHRLTMPWMAKVCSDFRWLHNYVSPRNVVAVRWLKRLGFVVSEELTPFGPKGALMRHFEMRTDYV